MEYILLNNNHFFTFNLYASNITELFLQIRDSQRLAKRLTIHPSVINYKTLNIN